MSNDTTDMETYIIHSDKFEWVEYPIYYMGTFRGSPFSYTGDKISITSPETKKIVLFDFFDSDNVYIVLKGNGVTQNGKDIFIRIPKSMRQNTYHR